MLEIFHNFTLLADFSGFGGMDVKHFAVENKGKWIISGNKTYSYVQNLLYDQCYRFPSFKKRNKELWIKSIVFRFSFEKLENVVTGP